MEALDRRADRFLAGKRWQSARWSARGISSPGLADKCARNEKDKTSSVQLTGTMAAPYFVETCQSIAVFGSCSTKNNCKHPPLAFTLQARR